MSVSRPIARACAIISRPATPHGAVASWRSSHRTRRVDYHNCLSTRESRHYRPVGGRLEAAVVLPSIPGPAAPSVRRRQAQKRTARRSRGRFDRALNFETEPPHKPPCRKPSNLSPLAETDALGRPARCRGCDVAPGRALVEESPGLRARAQRPLESWSGKSRRSALVFRTAPTAAVVDQLVRQAVRVLASRWRRRRTAPGGAVRPRPTGCFERAATKGRGPTSLAADHGGSRRRSECDRCSIHGANVSLVFVVRVRVAAARHGSRARALGSGSERARPRFQHSQLFLLSFAFFLFSFLCLAPAATL